MERIGKILLVRTDRLGDVILSLPMADAIKQKFPDANVGFLGRKYTKPAIEMSPFVDEIFTIEDKNLLEKISEYDAAVLVHPTFRDALLLWRARIKMRIGTAYRAYSFLLTHCVAEHRKDCRFHELSYNLHLLRPLGIENDYLPPKIVPPAEAVENADKIVKQSELEPQHFIAIHPGSGGSSLGWSALRFAEFADILSKRNIPFLVTAGIGEYELAMYVSGGNERAVLDELDVKTLAALYSLSSAVIAQNTGTLHLADAVGTKAFAVYPRLRTMSPKRWAPANFHDGAIPLWRDDELCKKCSKKCKIYPCTDTISAKQVISHIEKFVDFGVR